jgi:hypothetical protein
MRSSQWITKSVSLLDSRVEYPAGLESVAPVSSGHGEIRSVHYFALLSSSGNLEGLPSLSRSRLTLCSAPSRKDYAYFTSVTPVSNAARVSSRVSSPVSCPVSVFLAPGPTLHGFFRSSVSATAIIFTPSGKGSLTIRCIVLWGPFLSIGYLWVSVC